MVNKFNLLYESLFHVHNYKSFRKFIGTSVSVIYIILSRVSSHKIFLTIVMMTDISAVLFL
jgi:hypothetical protein